MLRELLIVALAIIIGFLATAAAGYFLHEFARSRGWSEPQLGVLVRYVLNPVIAAVVGSVVGAFAKRRAAVLAALSLLPQIIVIPLFKRLDFLHEAILVSLGLFYVLLGAAVAQLVFRVRTRTKPAT
jgi:hypothetical protein